MVGGLATAHANAGLYIFTSIIYPGSTGTAVVGINDLGQISGDYSGTGAFTGSVGGSVTSFAYPDASATDLSGINNSGQVAGAAFQGSSSFGFILGPDGTPNPFSITNAVYTAANSINDSGIIVGQYTPGSNPQGNTAGFVRQPNGSINPINYPGASNTGADGINDAGVVVGSYTMNGSAYGFVLSPNGSFTSARFNGLSTVLYGINASGTAVGWYIDSAGDPRGLIDSNGVLGTLDYPGSSFTRLYGVNDLGQLAGTAVVPVEINGNPTYEDIGFVATPVPLPASVWMMASALAGIGLMARGRTTRK